MSCFSLTDYEDAAELTGLSPEHIQAVAKVESPRGPFDEWGHPSVLFERHKFRQFTGGKWDIESPDLSNPTPGGYGKFSEQPVRLAKARRLDEEAALKATSWGAFQLMGFNHRLCGFEDLRDFEDAMRRSPRDQLMAFCTFILRTKIAQYILAEEWSQVAFRYNGPGYKHNKYDEKLEAAYRDAVVRRMVA